VIEYKIYFQFDNDQPQEFATFLKGKFEMSIDPTKSEDISSISFCSENGKHFRIFTASDRQLILEKRKKKLERLLNDNR